jgi:hypothetical protein
VEPIFGARTRIEEKEAKDSFQDVPDIKNEEV